MKRLLCLGAKKCVIGIIVFFSVSCAQAIDLSPNKIGGGDIPGGHTLVNFYLSNGDWVNALTLPNNVEDSAVINIISSAQLVSHIAVSNTEVGTGSLAIGNGQRYSLKYSGSQKRWNFDTVVYTPNTDGSTVPGFVGTLFGLSRYTIRDGNYTSSIKLPDSAPEGSLIFVDSYATYNARISSQGVLYDSTLVLKRGDSYIMQYKSNLKAWVAFKTPVRLLGALQVGLNMAAPDAPKTEVSFKDGDWVDRIVLPKSAGDRDKVIIKSTATLSAFVDNANMDFQGSMKLSSGESYEFMFIKEKGVWQLMAGPTMHVRPSSIVAGQLPNTSVPRIEYHSYDGGHHPVVKLPLSAKMGDTVIIRSNATLGFTVVKPYQSTGDRVTSGDTIRYVYNGAWVRATRIVTLLLVYSDEVSSQLGEAVIRARMNEGVRLTNEALENSGSNFYVKNVGFLKRASLGAEQGVIIQRATDDALIQNERNRVLADGIYYEGLEGPYCGLAWIRASAYYMVAAGHTGCGTTVMRHEFGHNMGLYHADVSASPPYARGYSLVESIMGGNSNPYFSSPRLYTADYGIPKGVVNQVDGVRAMDERSLEVSNYRGATGMTAEEKGAAIALDAPVADNRGGESSYVLQKGEDVRDVMERQYGIVKKAAKNVGGNARELYGFASWDGRKSDVNAVVRGIVEKRMPIEFEHSVLLEQKIGDVITLYVPEAGKNFQVMIDAIEIVQRVVRWSGHSINADPASNGLVISQTLDGDYAVGTLSTPEGAFNIEATKGNGWIVNQADDFVEDVQVTPLKEDS